MSVPSQSVDARALGPPSRRKALLIGIEYRWSTIESTVLPLSRPHKDVREFKKHLIRKWRYQSEDITIMLDHPRHPPGLQPTRANILDQIHKLVSQAGPNDHLVFYFAGHCYQLVSHDANELDGYDEAILTCDHFGEPVDESGNPLDPEHMIEADRCKLKGLIVDNELKTHLVDPLQSNQITLVSIFDTCHSGTLLDLTYNWTNKLKRALSIPARSSSTGKRVPPNSFRQLENSDKGDVHVPKSLHRGVTRLYQPGSTDSMSRSMFNGSSSSSAAPVLPPILTCMNSFGGTLCSSPTSEDEPGEDDAAHLTVEQSEHADRTIRDQAFEPGLLVPAPPCPSEGSSGRSSPHVISLAPTGDEGIAYENSADGESFTGQLLSVLDSEAGDLNLKILMERLRFRIFKDVTSALTKVYKNRKKSLDGAFNRRRRKVLENYAANPQIGTTVEDLDLEAPFRL